MHRAIDVARQLHAVGKWDGESDIVIHQPHDLHRELQHSGRPASYGTTNVYPGVLSLVEGKHYEIVGNDNLERDEQLWLECEEERFSITDDRRMRVDLYSLKFVLDRANAGDGECIRRLESVKADARRGNTTAQQLLAAVKRECNGLTCTNKAVWRLSGDGFVEDEHYCDECVIRCRDAAASGGGGPTSVVLRRCDGKFSRTIYADQVPCSLCGGVGLGCATCAGTGVVAGHNRGQGY